MYRRRSDPDDHGISRRARSRRGQWQDSSVDQHESSVDSRQPLASEPHTGHNRWHPEIEPILTVAPGEVLTLETRDGADGQLTQESTHDDVLRLDFGRSHPLTGPVYVEGAGPGDVLEVEILAYEWENSGVTPIIPGFGFLADLFPEPFLAKWAVEGDVARSAEIPGVSIPAEAFAGVLGVAPSLELMREQLERERIWRNAASLWPKLTPREPSRPSQRLG